MENDKFQFRWEMYSRISILETFSALIFPTKKEDKLIRNPGQMVYNDALPKFNMEPEKGTLE